MSGSQSSHPLDLAARREILSGGVKIERTPLLVPSFSSRVPEIEKVFRTCEEFIDGPLLVSAYDIAKGHLLPPYDFGSLVFLDSGGYEVSRDPDLADVSSYEPLTEDWSQKEHEEVLQSWKPSVPTVVVSYDHPRHRYPIEEQIERGKALRWPDRAVRELLLKPENSRQRFIQLEAVLGHAKDLGKFDIIGVTEKEIGNSVLERMKNIAKLRMALRQNGLETPIHVFGSMDTITTLFYFVVGADIFDGLTWLRYAFKDGNTLYRQNYGALELGLSTKAPMIEALCWSRNDHYLRDMELEMRRFLVGRDFETFKHHGERLAVAYKTIEEELEDNK
jgi:hypothetical protein